MSQRLKRLPDLPNLDAAAFKRGLLQTVGKLAMTAPLIAARRYPKSFDEFQGTKEMQVGAWSGVAREVDAEFAAALAQAPAAMERFREVGS